MQRLTELKKMGSQKVMTPPPPLFFFCEGFFCFVESIENNRTDPHLSPSSHTKNACLSSLRNDKRDLRETRRRRNVWSSSLERGLLSPSPPATELAKNTHTSGIQHWIPGACLLALYYPSHARRPYISWLKLLSSGPKSNKQYSTPRMVAWKKKYTYSKI
jgi:hypothetical protein